MLSSDLLAGARAAADYTGLPQRVIYHMTEAGRLPVVKLGKRLFYRKTELDRVFSPETREVA